MYRRIIGALVVGLVATAGVAVVPSLASSRGLWAGETTPFDLREEAFVGWTSDIDGAANDFADVGATPGPIMGMMGCGSIPLGPVTTGSMALFDGEHAEFTLNHAYLCRAGDYELPFLVLDGDIVAPDSQTPLGNLDIRFVRGSTTQAFSAVEVDFSDGRCFSIGPSKGFPGDGVVDENYRIQGWNFDRDSAVQCGSRTVSTTTSTSTTTTTSPDSLSSTTTTSMPEHNAVSTTVPDTVGSHSSGAPASNDGPAPSAVPLRASPNYAG